MRDQTDTNLMQISIHALREEGDDYRLVRLAKFDISIHALREEGDLTNVIDGTGAK